MVPLGFALIALGLAAMAYHGFANSIPKDVLDLSAAEDRTLSLSSFLGGVAVVVGTLMVLFNRH